jgi:hypothetical protein
MQVADLYGIRACLLDGGEIRGAGNAWICPEVLLLCSVLHFHSVTPLCLIESDKLLSTSTIVASVCAKWPFRMRTK